MARTLVTNMPLVLTLWAATHVPVIQDTQEMDLPVLQVCKLNLIKSTVFFVFKQQLFIAWFFVFT